ncbi:MAG: methionine ABC transporter ATP-binding protein [Lachnospirales bacterium]
MITIKNLKKTYITDQTNVEALKDINLSINEGEIYGVIGLSGAGKSSLVRCINLLERPTSGEIVVDGINLANSTKDSLREERKKIGMVFQHFNLLSSKTVYDNIAFPMKVSKFPSSEIHKKVTELLDIVGLSDKAKSYPAQLSGGQKQRVGIARALAANPKVIMCDEATSALDPTTTEQILELLKKVNKEFKITIIIITHEMDVIKKVCNRVAIMEDGYIIEEGTVKDLLIQPETSTAKKFFNKVNMSSNNLAYQRAKDKDGIIINAIFVGDKSTDPFISDMVKKYNVDASILLGNIQEKDHELIGNLVLKLKGEATEVENAIEFLRNSGVLVEVEND